MKPIGLRFSLVRAMVLERISSCLLLLALPPPQLLLLFWLVLLSLLLVLLLQLLVCVTIKRFHGYADAGQSLCQ